MSYSLEWDEARRLHVAYYDKSLAVVPPEQAGKFDAIKRDAGKAALMSASVGRSTVSAEAARRPATAPTSFSDEASSTGSCSAAGPGTATGCSRR